MKKRTSVILCLLCISLSYTLNLEAKRGYDDWKDYAGTSFPMDSMFLEHDLFPRREQMEVVDFEDDTAVSDTDNAIKAIKELLTYKTAPLLPSALTDDEHYNLFQLESKIEKQIFSDALLAHTKLSCLSKAIGHNRKFMNPRSVLNPDEGVITLIKETDWTESEIPKRILKHIKTQQEILKAYMLKYGPTIDALCEKYLDSSGD